GLDRVDPFQKPMKSSRMLTASYIGLALLTGVGFAVQVTLISAMAKTRGPLEATWFSLMTTVASFALIMAVRSRFGETLVLPQPFTRPLVFILVAAFAAATLVLLLRGLPLYF